ncbi:MAG: VPLPA-CTERM sorting domain-containing protein, partial [Paracoccaceae bacterium]
GFASSNPLSGALGQTSGFCGVLVDFIACGPADHGAGFDFGLADIAAGESYSFDIFYGGAANKTAALAALGAVGAELYSMGWSSSDGTDQDGLSAAGAITPTFIFAFKGVGGTIIVPPPNPNPVPLPAAGWMLLAGLGALAASRRRRKAA